MGLTELFIPKVYSVNLLIISFYMACILHIHCVFIKLCEMARLVSLFRYSVMKNNSAIPLSQFHERNKLQLLHNLKNRINYKYTILPVIDYKYTILPVINYKYTILTVISYNIHNYAFVETIG